MDKMDTKLDRREEQYRPRIYQGRGRGCGYRQNNYRSRNRSYSRDQYQNNYRGRGNYNRGGNKNYRSNYRDNSRSFNLYYIKGKDMVLSDFLSRLIEDDSDPHEIIQISFNIKEILKENYQNMVKDMYMVQTRSQAKAQANTPARQNTNRKSVTQIAIPKLTKYKLRQRKRKIQNHCIVL